MTRPRLTHVVATSAFAGVERYVCDAVSELHRRGWTVTVIGGDQAAMRRNLPDTVTHLRGDTAAAIAGALCRHPTDLVHAHMTAAEAAAAPLRGLRLEKLVTTRHFARPRGSSALGRLARPLIERRLDAQIAISEFVASAIGSEATVVPNGVPGSHQSMSTAARTRTVVVMQRLEPEKDTALALKAYAASGLADQGWTLVICGEGSQNRALRTLAAGLHINPDFAGFVDDTRAVLARAGVFLAPAPAEPFGLAVVEAMAEAVPVVASDGGAHPETLGRDGVLFPAGDARAAAQALRTVARDPESAATYGRALQRRHGERFTIERHVDRLEAVYEEVWNR